MKRLRGSGQGRTGTQDRTAPWTTAGRRTNDPTEDKGKDRGLNTQREDKGN